VNRPNARFCDECGFAFATSRPVEQRRTVTVLFCAGTTTVSELLAWLDEIEPHAGPDQFLRAYRSWSLARLGRLGDADSLDVLDRAARAAHLSIRFSEDGRARLEPEASGLDGALGRIVAVAFTAMADGSWNRLKACRRNVCHWVFYDRSRNHSSTWCAMSVCGNRTKTMAYRRRSARGRTS
jgi:hypothetical protein